MISVDIKNFQSIKEASLSFDPGITVITGSTNSGKTAIFRSIQSLLDNPGSAKYDIHDEEKKAEVILTIDGQPVVKWIRTASGVKYIIDNGNPNEKCGNADIWSFVPSFPIQQEPDKVKSILNFHTEFDTLFPFGYTPQELFKVFERVMALDDTASVLKAMNDDLNRVTLLRRHCNANNLNKRELVEEEERVLDDLALVLSSQEHDSEVNVLLLAIHERMNRVHQEATRLEELSRLLGTLSPFLSILSPFFLTPREKKDLKERDREIERKEEIEKDYSEEFNKPDRPEPSRLSAMEEREKSQQASRHDPSIEYTSLCESTPRQVKVNLNIENIRESVEQSEKSFRSGVGFYRAAMELEDYITRSNLLCNLQEPPELNLGLLEASQSLLRLLGEHLSLSGTLEALSRLCRAPELEPVSMKSCEDTSTTLDLLGNLTGFLKEKNDVGFVLSELKECQDYLSDEIAKYDTCELCGAPLVNGIYDSEAVNRSAAILSRE